MLGRPLGSGPLLQHFPLHGVEPFQLRVFLGIRAGELHPVTAGIEKVDGMDDAVVGDAEHLDAVLLQVGL